MRYAVTVRPEIARIGDGTRRRAGLTFSRQPVLLMVLPPEVAADPYLEVVELAEPAHTPAPVLEPTPEPEPMPEQVPGPDPEPAPAPPTPPRGRRTPRKARR